MQGISPGHDTAFARLTLEADREQARRVRFGYSDRVKIYLDGELVYSGDNTYRSRDYRYLGTIGWFDEIVIRLPEGRSELWFAVSERFGGWGVQAILDP